MALPKGSNVVPFWVWYGFGVRDDNILPKKELHRRVWVNSSSDAKVINRKGVVVAPLLVARTACRENDNDRRLLELPGCGRSTHYASSIYNSIPESPDTVGCGHQPLVPLILLKRQPTPQMPSQI